MRPALLFLLLAACGFSPDRACESVALGTSIDRLADTRPNGGDMCGHPHRAPTSGPVDALRCCRDSNFTSTTCGIACARFDTYGYGPLAGEQRNNIHQC